MEHRGCSTSIDSTKGEISSVKSHIITATYRDVQGYKEADFIVLCTTYKVF